MAPGILLVFKFKMSSEENFVQFVRVLLGFRWWIKRLIRWPAATGIDDFLKSVLHSLQHFGMLVGDVIFFLLVFTEVEKCKFWSRSICEFVGNDSIAFTLGVVAL